MDSAIVLTVMAADKPGIVDHLATIISGKGGNWLESRMCHLGGQFAGILQISVDSAREQEMLDALKALVGEGINLVVHPQPLESVAESTQDSVQIEFVGQDRPGIVKEIAHCLAANGANVEELNTECVTAPMSGEVLFQAKAKFKIPDSCDISAMKRELEKIATDLMVDIVWGEF